jgi:hypothetical protein
MVFCPYGGTQKHENHIEYIAGSTLLSAESSRQMALQNGRFRNNDTLNKYGYLEATFSNRKLLPILSCQNVHSIETIALPMTVFQIKCESYIT